MAKLESPLPQAARAIGDTREGVFVAIDLVRFTGDVLSALMLGQLLYWFGTGKDGFCRAQVKVKLTEDDIEKRGIDPALADGPWLAKGDEAWFEETGLTAAQARRVREMFKRDGWIATVTKRFAGNPTTHITLLPKLLEDLGAWYEMPAAERVKRDRITLARSARSGNDADGLANDTERIRLANDASPSAYDADESCEPRGSITEDLQSTSQTTSPPGGADVASDATPSPVEEPTTEREDGPFQIVARGFGYEPAGLPDPIRDKIKATLRAVKAAGLGGDLNFLADLVWLFRARAGRDPGKFGSAVAVLALDEDVALFPYRPEAEAIVGEALARVPALKGRCKGVGRAEAERAVAIALAADNSRGAIKHAMLTASQWRDGTLLTEITKLAAARAHGARPGRGLPEIPADLSEVDPLQLVEWLKAADGHDVSVAPRLAEALGRHLDAADLSNPDTVGDWRAVLRGDGWPRQGSVVFRLRGDLWDRLAAAADAQRKPPVVELTAGTTIRTLEGSTTR